MSMFPFNLAIYAEEVLEALSESYIERGGRVWSGAVELTPEECQAELADIVSCAEWAQFQRLMSEQADA